MNTTSLLSEKHENKEVLPKFGHVNGHPIAGVAFIVFGLWWAINVFPRYYTAKANCGQYKSRASYLVFLIPAKYRARQIPWEGICKIAGATAQIIYESVALTRNASNHITVASMFALSGIVDIIVNYNVITLPGVDYLALSLAVSTKYILLNAHLKNRPPVDYSLHDIANKVTALAAIVIILECKYNHSVLLGFARSSFATLAGCWYCYVGFVYYHEDNWHMLEGADVMYVVRVFVTQVAILVVIQMIVATLIKHLVAKFYTLISETDEEKKALISSGE